jgi:hypothetical protein
MHLMTLYSLAHAAKLPLAANSAVAASNAYFNLQRICLQGLIDNSHEKVSKMLLGFEKNHADGFNGEHTIIYISSQCLQFVRVIKTS